MTDTEKTIILYVTYNYNHAKRIMKQIQDMFEGCDICKTDMKNLIVTIGNIQITLFPLLSVNTLLVDRHTQYIIDGADDQKWYYEKMHIIRQRIMKDPKEITESEMWELLKEIKDGK